MKHNDFFAELDRIARDYEQRHQALKEMKEQILREKGWDSPELNNGTKRSKPSNTRLAPAPAKPFGLGETRRDPR